MTSSWTRVRALVSQCAAPARSRSRRPTQPAVAREDRPEWYNDHTSRRGQGDYSVGVGILQYPLAPPPPPPCPRPRARGCSSGSQSEFESSSAGCGKLRPTPACIRDRTCRIRRSHPYACLASRSRATSPLSRDDGAVPRLCPARSLSFPSHLPLPTPPPTIPPVRVRATVFCVAGHLSSLRSLEGGARRGSPTHPPLLRAPPLIPPPRALVRSPRALVLVPTPHPLLHCPEGPSLSTQGPGSSLARPSCTCTVPSQATTYTYPYL
ncbi:hypothetical protein B0H13DRAFT_616616 [Mycena leptocephala]|nr:hypothetical protein B0H13DRAFT_616616 [Mycena leptocephala]